MTDWAVKAADYIHSAYLSSPRPTRERTAAVIATHAAPLIALLRESRREHQEERYDIAGCNKVLALPSEAHLQVCDCGADEWNARIDAALK